MDVDKHSPAAERQRINGSFISITNPSPQPSSNSTAPFQLTPAPPPPPAPPVWLRGRPPLQRSAAELQAAATRFACPTCGKVLPTPYKLGRHTRTHTGDLPFACPLCAARFSDAHNISRHQRACRQRREMELAMQSSALSWPLWRQRPDEEEAEEWWQEEDVDGPDGAVVRLPRLSRWLFPSDRDDTSDAEVT